MGEETGIDNGSPDGHDAECREEGETLQPEGGHAVHSSEDAATPQCDIETLRTESGMRHA